MRKVKHSKLVSLLLCVVLFATLLAGCTDNNAEPTASNGNDAAASPGNNYGMYSRRPASATYEVSTESSGDISYTTYRYTSKSASSPTYTMGENLAKGKTATTNSILAGYSANSAIDSNTATLWASNDEVKNPYLQIDLGSSMKIGSVELVPRSDTTASHAGHRAFFEIQVSNDPEFKEYKVLGGRNADPFPAGYTFIANCDYDETFRYVRLQGTHNTTHRTVAELRVYADQMQLIEERPVEAKQDGAMQIISKTTGKALMTYSDVAVIDEYTFRNTQRWIIEDAGNNTIKLKNCSNGKYLTCSDYKLSFSDTADNDSQLWIKEDLGANWFSLTSKTGGMLTINEGFLAVSSGNPKTDDIKWDISDAYVEEMEKADTSWMHDCYGVMYHLLPTLSNKSKINKNIDVDAICDQLVEAGVSYFLLSFGQNSGYFISPNEKFSSIVTLKPDNRYTDRDLFREFGEALKERGIKLMAYTTSLPSASFSSDRESFLVENDVHSRESAMLWSMVLREWSLEYGDLISGWWVDGGYADNNPDDDILDMLVNGMKAGNPDTVIAINPGILIAERGELCEITAGETDFPFGSDDLSLITNPDNWMTPEHNKVSEDVQWFMLTFLNVGWAFNDHPRDQIYDKELWADYVKTVLDQKGAICLDVTFDPENNYKILPEMMEILTAIKSKCAAS